MTVQAEVSNNCALCHSGDPSTWTAANPGFDEQKMKEQIKADLSGFSGNANDTAVLAQMMLSHGKVGWSVAVSPRPQEGAQSKIFFIVTESKLTISSHNAINEEKNATSSTTSNARNQTGILNETTGAAGNSTLTITTISAPSYANDRVTVSVKLGIGAPAQRTRHASSLRSSKRHQRRQRPCVEHSVELDGDVCG